MLAVDIGVTGAKRQSYKAANPREVLFKLAQRYEEARAKKLCWDQIQDDPNMVYTIYEYWFANNYRSVRPPQKGTRARKRSEYHAAAEQLKERLQKHIEEQVKIKLFDMVMPNGKPLHANNREELILVGGWAARIVDRLQLGQTVAEAGLTEDDLRTLYAG